MGQERDSLSIRAHTVLWPFLRQLVPLTTRETALGQLSPLKTRFGWRSGLGVSHVATQSRATSRPPLTSPTFLPGARARPMRARPAAVLTLLPLLLSTAAAAADFSARLGRARPAGAANGPGPVLYAARLARGGVLAVNVSDGAVRRVVGDAPRAAAVDLAAWGDALFVAGGGAAVGGAPELRVYAVDAGEKGDGRRDGAVLARCTLGGGAGFAAGVAARGAEIFVTDALAAALWVVDARAARRGECVVGTLALPKAAFGRQGDRFKAAGIVPYRGGLLIAQEDAGAVYHVVPDMRSGNASRTATVTQVVKDGGAPSANGLVVVKSNLYVVQTRSNVISVWALSTVEGALVATPRGNLTSDHLQSPVAAASYKGMLYAVNARFEDVPFPHENERAGSMNASFAMVGVPDTFLEERTCWGL